MSAKISRHHYASEGPLKELADDHYVFHGEWKGSDGATYVWSKDHAAERYSDETEQRLAHVDTTMQRIKAVVVYKELHVTARKVWRGSQCSGHLKINGGDIIEGTWFYSKNAYYGDRREKMILKTGDGRSFTESGFFFMQE